MATLSEMLGIMQTGGTAIRQGFSEGMDRKRQSMLDANELERQKRLDEQNKKESDARLGLVELQTKSARRDLDQAMEGDAESKNLIGGVRETMQRDIEEFSKNVTTPEDEQILKQAKDNFRMVNAMSKYDQEKAAKFAVGPFELKQQMEAQKQKALRENEKFGLEKSKIEAEVGATKALEKERMAGATKSYADAAKTKKETSFLGTDEIGKEGFRLGKTTKEGLYASGSTFIPGLKPKPDTAITKKSVDELKLVAGFYDKLKFGITELTNLQKKHGTEIVGETADQMRTIASDIYLNAKELYNLGVLNKGDLPMLQSIIPDPSSFVSNVKSNLSLGMYDPYTPKMKQFEKIMDRSFEMNANRLGFDLESEPVKVFNDTETNQTQNINKSDDDKIKEIIGGGKSFTPSWKKSGATGGY